MPAEARAPRSARHRAIARVLWVILGLNWTVSLCKLALGALTHSSAIFADGLHSFSDGTSNVIGLVAISLARHPADDDHHYGHQKYETFASLLVAFLLLLLAFEIFKDAWGGLWSDRRPEITTASFVVMAATFLVNLFVSIYERRKARELQSEILHADAWHTASDLFITLSVMGSLVATRLGVPKLDSVLAFVIGGLVLGIAVKLIKPSLDVLVDKSPVEPQAIEAVVRKVEGVRDCHEIRARGRKDEVYVDLHVLVDDGMTVQDAHRLSNVIEKDIIQAVAGVRDVVVHIEPVSHGHSEH